MQAEYKDGELSIDINPDDLCYLCDFKDECPLVGALLSGLAVPTYNDLVVERCALYCPDVKEEPVLIESFLDRLRVAFRILKTGEY